MVLAASAVVEAVRNASLFVGAPVRAPCAVSIAFLALFTASCVAFGLFNTVSASVIASSYACFLAASVSL